jgi:hypothetical protein
VYSSAKRLEPDGRLRYGGSWIFRQSLVNLSISDEVKRILADLDNNCNTS